jgi:flagellar basal body-associated protein FliL
MSLSSIFFTKNNKKSYKSYIIYAIIAIVVIVLIIIIYYFMSQSKTTEAIPYRYIPLKN